MIADLHAHYPMRIVTEMTPETAAELIRERGGRPIRHPLQALVLKIANRVGNNPTWDGTYRITPETLRAGEVGLAMSVLFRAFEEMDLGRPYAAPPDPGYFDKLIEDLELVEAEVETHDRSQLRFVHNRAELDESLAAGATALVHCVEGGFHLGDTDAEVRTNCAKLKEKGVGYVTIAHLFFRQVATNANAIPFIPDRVYRIVFPQHGRKRLTDRGRVLIDSLVENEILIDLSHMDPPGIRQTLAFLDEIDPAGEVPVLSTHAGYRFGKQRYMHDPDTLEKIAGRNGVVGLIMAQHQLNDGLREKDDHTETLDESLEVIFQHIDEIARITGFDHIGLGTDFDGFVKPTPGGLKTMADLPSLEAALRGKYGDQKADLITSGNALRVLRTVWR